jgi:regulator of sigma E protease
VLTALLMILVADVLIFVHEIGHFVAARSLGMPATSFSVGFGPALFKRIWRGTEYRLALVPLGGYVRIEGMRGTDEERERWPHGFAFQPLWKRLVVIGAGVGANALLALFLYSFVSVTNEWSGPVDARVVEVDQAILPPTAGWSSVPSSRTIEQIDARPVSDWSELALTLLGSEEGFHTLEFDDGSSHRVWVPGAETAKIQLLEALIPAAPEPVDNSLSEGVAAGTREVGRTAKLIGESGRLLATGAIGIRQLSGPIEIARLSERTLRMSWSQFLAFLAFLSLNLAILNALPIPVLDGGHFALLMLEGVAGRPLPAGLRRYSTVAGATVIMFLMSFVLLNDLLRLFGR